MTPEQAALAQSGIQAAADVGTGIFGYLSAEQTRNFNRDEAQKARDWSYQMWLKQNEYDSPSAKMQRLVAAGLNPNLAYGSLDAMGNPVGNSEQAHSSAMAPVPHLSAPDLLQAKLAEAQINRMNTQNDNDTKMTDAQIERFSHLNDLSVVEVKRCAEEIELCKSRNQEVLQGIENMKQQWALLDEQKKQAAYQTAFIAATQELKIAATNEENRAIAETAVSLAVAQVLNIKADTAMKWSQTALNKQYGRESETRMQLNNAQMKVAEQQARLIASQINSENLRTESIMYQMSLDRNNHEFFTEDPNDGWFTKGVKSVLRCTDAACRMLGQIVHGTVVARY